MGGRRIHRFKSHCLLHRGRAPAIPVPIPLVAPAPPNPKTLNSSLQISKVSGYALKSITLRRATPQNQYVMYSQKGCTGYPYSRPSAVLGRVARASRVVACSIFGTAQSRSFQIQSSPAGHQHGSAGPGEGVMLPSLTQGTACVERTHSFKKNNPSIRTIQKCYTMMPWKYLLLWRLGAGGIIRRVLLECRRANNS